MRCDTNQRLGAMCFGEFFGTFLLVLFGTAAVAVAVLFEAHVGLLQVAALWGVGVTLAIYATRHLSCAHLNPAVSLGMLLAGRMQLRLLPWYWMSQLLGAVAAGVAVLVMFHGAITDYEAAHQIIRGTPESIKTAMMFGEYFPNPGFSASGLSVSPAAAMLAEALGTFLLVTMIFALTEGCNVGRPSDALAPVFIGATVTAVISIVAPLTQAGINPARDFGPRLVSYFAGWSSVAIPGPRGGFFLVYIAAPLVGGAFAAFCFRFLVAPLMVGRKPSTASPVTLREKRGLRGASVAMPSGQPVEFEADRPSNPHGEGDVVSTARSCTSEDCFESLIPGSWKGLQALGIETMQVNVGLQCNQQCRHCHLNCSPVRTETMDWSTMEMVVAAAGTISASLVDITGGAPELNPNLARFVEALDRAGHAVQVRTNLTVLLEPGLEDMIQFFRAYAVRLVASMPCYREENVRAQRGPTVYERSVDAIRYLNAAGYGVESGLQLNLVYNPGGPFLPPEQSSLEQDYRRELGERFGLSFTSLLTITNMPLGRFGEELRRQRRLQEYLDLLRKSFNPATVEGLMCRHQVSVGWDGTLYDCDFNLALRYPVDHGAPDHIRRFDPSALRTRRIVTGRHCFGCTAGCGSSCSGALA